ncbi:hypothetical protein D1872_261000 [compost metagenome]
MRIHTNRLQRIKQKMRINLTGHHFQLNLTLRNFQHIVLLCFFNDLLHQPVNALHHIVKLSGQLANLIVTINTRYDTQITQCQSVQMTA